jgi:hypothetical protein
MLTGYRTYIAAALVAIFGALAATDWISFLDDPKAGAVAIASAILMALMRSFTTTPAGSLLPLLRATR